MGKEGGSERNESCDQNPASFPITDHKKEKEKGFFRVGVRNSAGNEQFNDLNPDKGQKINRLKYKWHIKYPSQKEKRKAVKFSDKTFYCHTAIIQRIRHFTTTTVWGIILQ